MEILCKGVRFWIKKVKIDSHDRLSGAYGIEIRKVPEYQIGYSVGGLVAFSESSHTINLCVLDG